MYSYSTTINRIMYIVSTSDLQSNELVKIKIQMLLRTLKSRWPAFERWNFNFCAMLLINDKKLQLPFNRGLFFSIIHVYHVMFLQILQKSECDCLRNLVELNFRNIKYCYHGYMLRKYYRSWNLVNFQCNAFCDKERNHEFN